MAMRSFYNEIRNMRLKDQPAHIKPMLSPTYIKDGVNRGLDNYHKKFILTSSINPLYHVCFGSMALSYLMALPEERRHLEHKLHAMEHGDASH